MLRKAILTLLPLAMCGAGLAQDAPPVDDLIAKNITARGGADKLKAVQSVKITGKMTAPNGMELPLNISVKRPGMIRMEMNIQGKSIVQGFDGTNAWSINPMTGNDDPKLSSEDEAKSVRENADSMLDGPLVGYKSKGSKVEYVGKEDVEGSPAYKLRITTRQGTVMYDYLDAKTGLEVRSTAKVSQMGQEMEVDTYPGNYKPEGGVLMAHSIESRMNGTPMMKMSMDKVEVNAPLDDTVFKMPAKSEPQKQ